MKVLEYEAKALLKDAGLPVPDGELATTLDETYEAAVRLGGPVVIKAQIPMGRRMKAGGVLFADSPPEARQAADRLLGQNLLSFTVPSVLVERRVDAVAELFVAATYDSRLRRPIILASRGGGIEVEQTASVIRRPFSGLIEPSGYVGREVAGALGFGGRSFHQLGSLINGIIRRFLEWDALTLELNPIILDTTGSWWIADAHLELDDDALYRQEALIARLPQSVDANDQRTAFEREAAAIDSADHRGVAGRLIPFDGTLGMLIGGGGASLTVMDALLDAGLDPANYCEIGGNPSVWKIKELTKLILRQPGVERLAVIMNVVSNTRVDLVARGVIKGILELGLDPRNVIAAFRIPGSWEEEGQAIMRHYGVPFYGRETSIDQVVEAVKANVNPR